MFNLNPEYVKIEYVIIPLTQGQVALIDPVDADLAMVKWCAQKVKKQYYVARALPGKGMQRIHRVILSRMINRDLGKTDICDHKDGNPLNNRRENLRLATSKDNSRNRKLKSKTGYKGVTWVKPNTWKAQITVDGNLIIIGLYDSPELAHEAYKEKAVEYFGEFARFI